MSALAPYDLNVGFDRLFGLQFTRVDGDGVAGHVRVGDRVRQPAGLVHGGVYAAMAESLATNGTAAAVHAEGNTAVGMSNQTSFLRPITRGTIHATGRPRHRGRTTWVWEVELADDEGRLCGLTRVTVAVRPRG